MIRASDLRKETRERAGGLGTWSRENLEIRKVGATREWTRQDPADRVVLHFSSNLI